MGIASRVALPFLTACLVAGGLTAPASAASFPPARFAPVPVAAAAASMTPQEALDIGAQDASNAQDARTYAAVVDRATGKIIAETDNAGEQVASESIVKLFLAAYYLVRSDGRMDADLEADMHEMIVRSDDNVASAYWTTDAVPTIAARYGLTDMENNPDNPGRWGGTRITAEGMALFLYRMSKDPEVGPWLVPTMRETENFGIDGYDQNFGFNALDGVANKQGWGSDNFSDQANAVHSVGLTERYAAAVLQTGPQGTYRTMGVLASETARLLVEATPPALPAPTPSTTAPRTSTAPRTAAGGGTSTGPSWWSDALKF